MTQLLNFIPPVIAHRGASGYAPENTMVAFTLAAQLGIKWLEFDVMLAADQQPIIFHDETLDRTTNKKGDIGIHTTPYLRALDAGVWFHSKFSGEKIPTLQQVAEFLLDSRMRANVEIKPLPGQEEMTAVKALNVISQYFVQPHPSILFSSFSVPALRHLRKHSPDCLIGLLLHEWEPNWQSICDELNCVSVHVNQEIMTQEAAQEIKAMNRALLCYTVNDPARALELYSWGVDAVFSDFPDKIAKAWERS